MEENELKDEAVVEETVEEVVEETPNDTPTLEDYERLKKEKETLLAQKEHWRKKAETPKEVQPLIKKEINETQSGLSREEAILYAKGYTDDEVTLANKLAKVNGISVLEAVEDDYLKTMRAKRLKKEQSEKAALPASSGSGRFKSEKPIGEMSEEEHRAYFNKVMGVN